MNSLVTISQANFIDNNGFQLSEQEQKLVLLWRSLKNAILDVVVQNKIPVYAKVNYPDLLARLPVQLYPFTEQESWYIKLARQIRYGKLVIKIEDGIPVAPMTASQQTWNLAKDALDIEIEG